MVAASKTRSFFSIVTSTSDLLSSGAELLAVFYVRPTIRRADNRQKISHRPTRFPSEINSLIQLKWTKEKWWIDLSLILF